MISCIKKRVRSRAERAPAGAKSNRIRGRRRRESRTGLRPSSSPSTASSSQQIAGRYDIVGRGWQLRQAVRRIFCRMWRKLANFDLRRDRAPVGSALRASGRIRPRRRPPQARPSAPAGTAGPAPPAAQSRPPAGTHPGASPAPHHPLPVQKAPAGELPQKPQDKLVSPLVHRRPDGPLALNPLVKGLHLHL